MSGRLKSASRCVKTYGVGNFTSKIDPEEATEAKGRGRPLRWLLPAGQIRADPASSRKTNRRNGRTAAKERKEHKAAIFPHGFFFCALCVPLRPISHPISFRPPRLCASAREIPASATQQPRSVTALLRHRLPDQGTAFPITTTFFTVRSFTWPRCNPPSLRLTSMFSSVTPAISAVGFWSAAVRAP